jgi:hypothetical protein
MKMNTLLNFIWFAGAIGSFLLLNNISKKIIFKNKLAEIVTVILFILVWFLFMIFLKDILGIDITSKEYT